MFEGNITKRITSCTASVMLSCKLAQGTQDAFVRDVKAAPDPQSILFYDWQICDMERFLTRKSHFGILTSDPTYNLGQFYVTPITYPHLMLQDITSKKDGIHLFWGLSLSISGWILQHLIILLVL